MTTEAKRLYRRIATLFAGLPPASSPERMAARLVPGLLEHLGAPLGLRAAQLYRREVDRMLLLDSWGEPAADLAGELPHRLTTAGPDGIHDLPWVGRTAAGVTGLLAVDLDERLIAVLLAPGDVAEPDGVQLGAALSAIHYGLGQTRHRHELEDTLERSRAIQMSLLPPGQPSFAGFDIAALSAPAESVGGDLYDFITDLFERLRSFGDGGPLEDDVTVVMVRRPA